MIDKIRFKLGDTAYYRAGDSVRKFVVDAIKIGKRYKSDKHGVFYGVVGHNIDNEIWYEDNQCFLNPSDAFESDV